MFGMFSLAPATPYNTVQAQLTPPTPPPAFKNPLEDFSISSNIINLSRTIQRLDAAKLLSMQNAARASDQAKVEYKPPLILPNISPAAAKACIRTSLKTWMDLQNSSFYKIICENTGKSFTICNAYAAHWWHYSQVNFHINALHSIIEILREEQVSIEPMAVHYEHLEPPIELTLISFIFAFFPHNQSFLASGVKLLEDVAFNNGIELIASPAQKTLESALRRVIGSTTHLEHYKAFVYASDFMLRQMQRFPGPEMQCLIEFALSNQCQTPPNSIQIAHEREILLNQMSPIVGKFVLLIQNASESLKNSHVPTEIIQEWLRQTIQFLSPDKAVLETQYIVIQYGASFLKYTISLEQLIHSICNQENEPSNIYRGIPPISTYESLQKNIVQCKQAPNPRTSSTICPPNIMPNEHPCNILYALNQWFELVKSTTSWGGKGFWGPRGNYVEVNHPLLFLWMHFSWPMPHLGVQTELLKLATLYSNEDEVSFDLGIAKTTVPLGWALFYGLPEYILQLPESRKVVEELLNNQTLPPGMTSPIANATIPLLTKPGSHLRQTLTNSINTSLSNLPIVLNELQKQLANVFIFDGQSNLSFIYSGFYLQTWCSNLHHISPLSQDPFARVLFNVLKKSFERGMRLENRICWLIMNLYEEVGKQLRDGTLLNHSRSNLDIANRFKSWILELLKTLSDQSNCTIQSVSSDYILKHCEDWLVFDGKSPVQNYILQRTAELRK